MKIDREKLMVGLLIVVALAFVGFKFVYGPLTVKKEALLDEMATLGSYDVNVENMQNQDAEVSEKLNQIDQRISELKSGNGSATMNIQDFLLFLSTKAKELDVDIVQFKDLGVKEENGVWRVRFDTELKGNMKDLIRITQNIEDLGVSYDVKSVSLRQEGDVEHLHREYNDTTALEWYAYKEEKEEVKELEEIIEVPEVTEEVVELPPVEVVTETIIVENDPKTLEEQLDALLGISVPKKEVKTTTTSKPKPVVKAPVIKTPVKVPSKPIVSDISTTKMKLDFTIEFIMFSDPSSNFGYIDMYKGLVKDDTKQFVIDSKGTKLTNKEVDSKIKNDEEFLNSEIDRLMVALSEDTKEFEGELKDYLNYLLGKR